MNAEVAVPAKSAAPIPEGMPSVATSTLLYRAAPAIIGSPIKKALDYATEHNLAIGAGSDAHVAEAIGAAYMQMPDFDNPTDFLESMRSGQPVGHYYDPPRQWKPRIVPSTAD